MDKKKTNIIIIIFIFFVAFLLGLIFIQFILPKELRFSFDLIGNVPLCNRKKEHAPIIGNFVFPLCWRCTFMILSFIIGILIFYLTKMKKIIASTKLIYLIIFCLILVTPLIIDGFLQYFFGYESNTLKRIVTGSLFGTGISILTTKIILNLFEI